MAVLNRRLVGVPAGSVYVGRPTLYGNPFYPGIDGSLQDVLNKYEKYVMSNPKLVSHIKSHLKGKDLVCWCAPNPCHADILHKIANE